MRLQSLTLTGNGLTSLKGLQLPSSLLELDLSNNRILTPQDLEPLAAFVYLQSLTLRQNDLTSLKGLQLPLFLLKLDLSDNPSPYTAGSGIASSTRVSAITYDLTLGIASIR